MRSKRTQEHYILIDHRNSPGVTREFVAASGLRGPVVGAGETFEAAMTTCPHCWGDILRHPQRKRERIWCRKCDAYICDNCAIILKATGEHKTQWQIIAEIHEKETKGRTL